MCTYFLKNPISYDLRKDDKVFYDVFKCLSIKQEYMSLNNLGSKHSLLMEIWPVRVILQKKKIHQKILQKLRPKN